MSQCPYRLFRRSVEDKSFCFLCRKTHVALWRWYCADHNFGELRDPRLRCSVILSPDIIWYTLNTERWCRLALSGGIIVHHSADQWNVAELHKTALWLPTRGGFSDTILNWVCTGKVRSPKRCTFKSEHTWKVQYSGVCLWLLQAKYKNQLWSNFRNNDSHLTVALKCLSRSTFSAWY